MGFPPPIEVTVEDLGVPPIHPPSLSKEGCRGVPPYTKVWGGVLQTPPPPSNEGCRSGLRGSPPL